jgi:hypothetical protein
VWNSLDSSHKPPGHFIQLIAKESARGGNLLLNIGPRGDGTIDPPDVQILKGIGKWMSVNGESIKGTQRTPLPVQAWGESTVKANTLYLHVFNWPKDGKLLVGGLQSKVAGAYLLADANKSPLKAEKIGELDVQITVPQTAPDSADSVVVVSCEPDVLCDSTRLLSTKQENALRVFDGELTGKPIRFGPGKKTDAYVIQWSRPDNFVSWKLRLAEPATFKVSSLYDAANEGGTYVVDVGTQKFASGVKKGKLQTDSLGTVKLSPGIHEIKVTAEKIAGDELMNLRTVTLTPEGK